MSERIKVAEQGGFSEDRKKIETIVHLLDEASRSRIDKLGPLETGSCGISWEFKHPGEIESGIMITVGVDAHVPGQESHPGAEDPFAYRWYEEYEEELDSDDMKSAIVKMRERAEKLAERLRSSGVPCEVALSHDAEFAMEGS